RRNLLARAGGPGDQHAAPRRRDALDRLPHGIDGRRYPDQLALRAGTQAQFGVLAAKLRGLDGPLYDEQQPVGLERLLDEVVGTFPDRGHGRLDRPVPADHDDRDQRVLLLKNLQQVDPVMFAALEPHVENDEARLPRPHRGQGARTVGRRTGLVALILEDAGDQHPDIGLVVDDQYVTRHVPFYHLLNPRWPASRSRRHRAPTRPPPAPGTGSPPGRQRLAGPRGSVRPRGLP